MSKWYPGEQTLQLYELSPIKGVGVFSLQFPIKSVQVQGKLTRCELVQVVSIYFEFKLEHSTQIASSALSVKSR